MSDLQKLVEDAIVATLTDPEGAGSDLLDWGDREGEWMFVEGNLDIPHLASEVIRVIEEAEGD